MSLALPLIAFTSTGKPHAATRRCWKGARAMPVVLALLVGSPRPAGGGAVQLMVMVLSTAFVLGSMRAIRGLPVGATPGTVTQNLLSPGSHTGCSNPPAFANEITFRIEYGGFAETSVAYGSTGQWLCGPVGQRM